MGGGDVGIGRERRCPPEWRRHVKSSGVARRGMTEIVLYIRLPREHGCISRHGRQSRPTFH